MVDKAQRSGSSAVDVQKHWDEVSRFLDDPSNQAKVSEPTARHLLELHHGLDGFELPEKVERSIANRLGLKPEEAKDLFKPAEKGPRPSDAQNFRDLGRLLVDDLTSAVSALPMGPINAVRDALAETREVMARSKQPHLSKAEKKELRKHFDHLHGTLRKEMNKVQTGLSEAEQARAQLLSDETGAPIEPDSLDARQQIELRKIDQRINEAKGTLHQLGNVGQTLTALRGESFWEQNWMALNAGVELNAFMPVASMGLGGVREISVRDPKTGQTETKDSASAIGLFTNGFARKVVSAEDLKKGKWKDLLSTKGLGGGTSPLPFVNVVRDPVVGDVIGVFIPGLMFAEINSRPDGKAGFGGGLVFHLPGLPVGPHVSANWNHPLFKPLISRAIAPLSQVFEYAIRTFQLGVLEPGAKVAEWVKGQVTAKQAAEVGSEPPKTSAEV